MGGAEVRIRRFQTVQTQNEFDLSIDGNTVGAGTLLISSGTLTLFAGNNITLSQDMGNIITISSPDMVNDINIVGNTAGAGTADISSGTLFLAGGNNITLSQDNNNTITISGANMFSAGVSNLGNTLGTTGLVSQSVYFVGGTNITLSESNDGSLATITIMGGAGGTASAGAFSAGVSDSGNTFGTTGTVSNQLVFVGSGIVSLSQSANLGSGTITIIAVQSGQTGSIIQDVAISGNTSGASASITSGTMTLAGGNNITLSQAANAITISGPNAHNVTLGGGNSISGGAGFIQISTGTMSLVGGNNITLSQNGNAITISGPNTISQSVQTGSIIRDVNLAGNTSGTLTDISSGTLVLAGGYGITLSQNANTVTISGGEQLTAVVSNLGNTAGTTGAPVKMDNLVFVGGSNITLSQSIGGADTEDVTITINAQSQSLQTSGLFDLTVAAGVGGNTSGTLALVSSGTLTLAAGNAITLSQVGNAITISAAPMLMAGVGSNGNTSGDTGVVSDQVVFAGGNNITLSQSTNLQSATITISGPNMFSAGVSNLGNTVGTTGPVSGLLVLVGGSNVTLSESSVVGGTGTITINVANQTTQTSNIINAVSLSAGNTAGVSAIISSGTLYLAGGQSITLSQNANSITISGATTSQSLQTQSRFNLTAAGNSTSAGAGFILISSGVMTLAGGNNVTLSQNGNAITVSAFSQTVQTQNNVDITLAGNSTSAGAGFILVSSGTLTLAGGTNITLSQNGNAVTISGATTSQSVQTSGLFDLTVGGNSTSAGAGFILVSSGTLTLAGGPNITLSQAGNAISIVGATAAGASFSAGVTTLGNSAGTTGVVSNQIVFVGGSNVSLSESINGGSATVTINAATVGGGSFSAGIDGGNKTGDTGTVQNQVVFAGGNNVTLSGSTNAGSMTITISAPVYDFGVSNVGNTSGTTGISTRRLVLAGDNNITLSQSIDVNGFQTVTISALASSGLTGAGNVSLSSSGSTITISGLGVGYVSLSAGNTSGTSTLISSGTMYLAGGSNITLSQIGNSITIVGPTTGGGGVAIANSETTFASSTVNLLEGGGAITIASSAGGQTLRFSVPAKTSLVQSGNVSLSSAGSTITISGLGVGYVSLSAGNTSGTSTLISSGTMYLAGINDIVLSQVGNSITISVSGPLSAGASSLGNTAGTTGVIHDQLVFVGGNKISLSQSNNLQSGTLTINGPNMFSAGVSSGGNSAGSTGPVSGLLVFVGGSNISLSESSNAGSGTITINGLTQSAQTGSIIRDVNIVAGAGGSTSGTTAEITSGTMTLAAGNNITLSQVGNAITISGLNQSVQTQSAFNLTLASNSTSAGAGFILISSGTFTLAGGANITLSQNGNAVSILGAGAGTGGGIVGLANSESTFSSGTVNLLEGGGAITIKSSVGGQSLKFSVPATSSLVGAGNVTITTAGSTITVSGIVPYISQYPVVPLPFVMTNTIGSATTNATTAQTSGSAWIFPMPIPCALSVNDIKIPVYMATTITATGTNWSFTNGLSFGIYSRSGNNLSLVESFYNNQKFSHASTNTSGSASATFSMNWGGSATNITSASLVSTASATAAAFYNLWGGSKMWPMIAGTKGISFSAGQYWGMIILTATTAGSALVNCASLGQVSATLATLQEIGLATANTSAMVPFMGIATVIINAASPMPSAYAFSDVKSSSNNVSFATRLPYVLMNGTWTS